MYFIKSKGILKISFWERNLEISSFLQNFFIGPESIYVYIVLIQLSFHVLTDHLPPCYSCTSNVCVFANQLVSPLVYFDLHYKHTYTLLRFSLSLPEANKIGSAFCWSIGFCCCCSLYVKLSVQIKVYALLQIMFSLLLQISFSVLLTSFLLPHSRRTPVTVAVVMLLDTRPSQLAELPRREFDPELFPHSAYVQFLWHSRQKRCI